MEEMVLKSLTLLSLIRTHRRAWCCSKDLDLKYVFRDLFIKIIFRSIKFTPALAAELIDFLVYSGLDNRGVKSHMPSPRSPRRRRGFGLSPVLCLRTSNLDLPPARIVKMYNTVTVLVYEKKSVQTGVLGTRMTTPRALRTGGIYRVLSSVG
jgi:hypothetical protein